MDLDKLYILERRFYTQIPLIGTWLRQKAVEILIRDGSSESVRVLTEAVTRCRDRQAVKMAVAALRRLTDRQCINTVCAVWATSRHPTLAKLIIEREWVASKPVENNVLSAMKTGKIDAVVLEDAATVIDLLVHTCNDSDNTIRRNAQKCLCRLPTQEAREILCQKAIEEKNPIIHEIVKEAQYAPHDPTQRALFYFLTEQWDQYEQLDFDQTLLKRTYPHLNTTIQKRLAACARETGRIELIEVVIDAHHQKKQLAKMTPEDWNAALSILSARQAWPSIWQLAQLAPALWSVRLLSTLRGEQWTPEREAEQAVFERMSRLAEHCQRGQIEPFSRYMECAAILPHRAAQTHRSANGLNNSLLGRRRDWVGSLAISPDGQVLASGGMGGAICVWRLSEGEIVQTLEGHATSITCVTISPDGRRLVSSDMDGTICVWRLPEGRNIRTIKGNYGDAECLAISPDGRLFASGGKRGGKVQLWRLPKGEAVGTSKDYQKHAGQNIIRCLAFTPDSRLLASGSQRYANEYGIVQLWQLPEGRKVQALQGHSGGVTCLAIGPDSRLLASGGFDRKVRLWRLPDGKALQTLTGHSDNVSCVAISPDGRLLASGGQDNTVWLWRLPEGRRIQRLKGHTDHVSCVAFSPDERLLASGSMDGTIRLWRSTLKRLVTVPVGQMTQQDMTWIEKTLQVPDLNGNECMWLELMLELYRWHRRYDIEIGQAPPYIPTGVFDIEIEGANVSV